MCDQSDGYFARLTESFERRMLVEDLRTREQNAMTNHGDCECAAAPICPMHRLPGELFENGLPDSVKLPK